MMDLANLFLAGMTTCGALVLGVALLLAALGLPIPTGLLVLAAGAFVRQGLMDWHMVSVVSLVGLVLGDAGSYALGRFAGRQAQRRVGQRRKGLWQSAQDRFRQSGAWAIFLTRFLFTPLDVPTNLIAGCSRYAIRRFLACAVAGRVAWVALYGGLGYVSGSHWEVIAQAVSNYGG